MLIFLNNTFIKSVGLITIIAIISKVLGFARELLIAAYFGATGTTDAFFVASIIPVLMFSAIGMALTTGLVPLYAEASRAGKKTAASFMNMLGTLFLVLSIMLSILFYISIPWITTLIAPGFSENEAELVNSLARIMIPSFCFYVLSAFMTGILEYEKRFSPPALIAVPQNILVIFAVVLFSSRYGIYSVAVATLLGAISQVIMLYPFFRNYIRFRLNFQFGLYREKIAETWALFFPMIAASVAYQINGVVDRMVASYLETGSVSALNFANKLMYLPLSIILLSLITVLFPSIIDAFSEQGSRFIDLISKGFNAIIFVAIPILAVMLVENNTLVSLAFERGAFDHKAASLTASAFFYYSFGMVFLALKELLNRCFIAMKEPKVTMKASIAAVLVNILFSILLARLLGTGGIALATSIAMLFQTVYLLVYLRKKLPIESEHYRSFIKNFSRLLVIFLITLSAVYAISALTEGLNHVLQLILSAACAGIIFLISSIVLKIEELSWLKERLLRKSDNHTSSR